mmetsp:Transcript_21733/g.31959  ORF Transcript_21733/g.31959 Transcript_21733/m.31959 type:complete len:99 (+) Transcript_21733:570-866(+)
MCYTFLFHSPIFIWRLHTTMRNIYISLLVPPVHVKRAKGTEEDKKAFEMYFLWQAERERKTYILVFWKVYFCVCKRERMRRHLVNTPYKKLFTFCCCY